MKKIKIYGSKFSPIVGIIMFFAFIISLRAKTLLNPGEPYDIYVSGLA